MSQMRVEGEIVHLVNEGGMVVFGMVAELQDARKKIEEVKATTVEDIRLETIAHDVATIVVPEALRSNPNN